MKKLILITMALSIGLWAGACGDELATIDGGPDTTDPDPNPNPDPDKKKTYLFDDFTGVYYGMGDDGLYGVYELQLEGHTNDSASEGGAQVRAELHLSLYGDIAPDPETAALSEGKYSAASGAPAPGMFVPGVEDTAGLRGSYIKYGDDSGMSIILITGGSLEITSDGIAFDFEDGEDFAHTGEYKGSMPVTFDDSRIPVLTAGRASGIYLGDIFSTDSGQYNLKLVNGETDAFGDLTGDGFIIDLELFSSIADDPADAAPEDGTYNPGDGTAASTYRAGYVNQHTGNIIGSKIKESKDGQISTTPLDKGSLSLSFTEGCNFEGKFLTANGRVIKVSYDGELKFTNADDVDESNILEYCEGNYYGDRKGMGSGEYLLDCYMMDFTPDIKLIFRGIYLNGFMELLGADDEITLAEGVYHISDSCAPFTFVPGSKTGEDAYFGTRYYETDTDMVTVTKAILITGGFYVIGRSGDDVVITTSFSGEDSDTGEKVTDINYRFTGTPSVNPATASVMSVARALYKAPDRR